MLSGLIHASQEPVLEEPLSLEALGISVSPGLSFSLCKMGRWEEGTEHSGWWVLVSLHALSTSSGPPRPGKYEGCSQHTHINSCFPPTVQTGPHYKHFFITSRFSLNPANTHQGLCPFLPPSLLASRMLSLLALTSPAPSGLVHT